MNLFDRLISVVAPFECLGCGVEGRLLCLRCATSLDRIPSRCYKCHKLTPEFRVCTSCKRKSKLYSVSPATPYKSVAKTLVGRLKFYGVQAAAAEIAALMRNDDLPANCVIVPIPTATRRARQRGYDQAKLVARSFARQNKLLYLDCLARVGQSHQVGATRAQRLNQLKGAYRVKTGFSVRGLQVILIDDVLTTGASLEAAAACLESKGAKRVYGCVFAQA